MKNLALVLVLAASFTACKTNKKYNADVAAAKDAGYASGTSDAEARAVKAANFMIALQAGSPTSSYEMIKFANDNANLVVLKYVSGGTTQYAAVDISSFSAGTNVNSYILSHEIYIGLTANGNGTFTCAAGCYNAAGAVTSTMVFEKTSASSKDLDKAAAFVEAYSVETTAATIAAEFGLSDERSVQVAKLAASWNKLAKSRALTNADADAFSQELAGVSMADMESAEKAMINGSASEMNAVLAKAAAVNGTTSENMALIMSKLFE